MASGMANGAERQLVVFDLANEVYGISIGTVREIIRMQTVTFVPDAPEFVEGVINLRGRVIPVVDLRKRFGLPVTEPTPESRVLVVDIGGNDIGVIVDAVTQVQRIAEASIEPAAALVTTEDSYYIEGIDLPPVFIHLQSESCHVEHGFTGKHDTAARVRDTGHLAAREGARAGIAQW